MDKKTAPADPTSKGVDFYENNAKENHPFIYDRATGEKIPVSKEVRGTYYGEADRNLLDRLFARLRELAPDADAIIARWMNGGSVSDRTIAKAPTYLRRPDEEVSDGVPAHPGLLIRSTPGPLTIGFTVAGGPLLFFENPSAPNGSSPSGR